MLKELHKTYLDKASNQLKELQQVAIQNENIFKQLMETGKYCSIGQITRAMFDVGGQYRRNM
jgi:methylmalonyl-CoA mutase